MNKSRLEDQKRKARWDDEERKARLEDKERITRRKDSEMNARREAEERQEEEQRKTNWEKNPTQAYPLDFSMYPGTSEPPLLRFDRTSYPGLLQAQFYSILQNHAESLTSRRREDTEETEDLYRHNKSNESSSSGIGTDSGKSADESSEMVDPNLDKNMSGPRAGFTGSSVLGSMGYSRRFVDSNPKLKKECRVSMKKRKREN